MGTEPESYSGIAVLEQVEFSIGPIADAGLI